MSQTEREQTEVRTLLADNETGLISPQDLRDALASHMGYAGLILTVAGAPAVMSSVSTTYALLDIFNLISAESVTVNTNGTNAVLSPTYSLTVGSTGIYRICFWASFSTVANNRLVTFRPHVNGSPGIVEVDRFLSTGSDTGVVSFEGIIPYTANDVIDMRVKLDTGTSDMSFLAAGFNIHRVG